MQVTTLDAYKASKEAQRATYDYLYSNVYMSEREVNEAYKELQKGYMKLLTNFNG
ncbi:hypothetical protein ACIQ1D_18745 [Lysinibacillus xylanilyticus]|uniref:hypothetical protein n=1 Tax=Lysinibacillus xylanilyticus TaxID=582475 RepID=UPI0037F5EB0D